jgi:hypothetical protein
MQAGTFEKFEKRFVPCPTSGCWLWIGSTLKNGYGVMTVENKTVYAHHFSMILHGKDVESGLDVDHVCGNRACVNPDHLRLATRSQNMMNTGMQKRNTSGFKGVCWDKQRNKWRSAIGIGRRSVYLGRFDNPEDAYSAYCHAAKTLHAEFYKLDRKG